MCSICPKCSEAITDPRKKYCSATCKYWFNLIKREKESHLPPVKKRTEQYFSMVVGSQRAVMKGGGRQGKRSGGMITGSMSAFIYCTVESVVEVNIDNLNRHFEGIQGYTPTLIVLGTGERVYKQDIQSRLGLTITNKST